MIDQIRVQQIYRQMDARRSLPTQQVATYTGRDPLTGRRALELADGSSVRAEYLSENEPPATPLYVPRAAIGLPAYIVGR